MNRRIPNGTYGGVGGRRLAAFSYPIIQRRYTMGLLRLVPSEAKESPAFTMTGG